jgi:alpha-D-ribose 1-methylphosphonate 5-triphosphate synthase subunit PhnH
MNHQDLYTLGAGFGNEALGSQAVFRYALEALSHPGRLVDVVHDATVPASGHAVSAALLLALLDSDCTLWLSPKLSASDAALWLHFHTGCHIVTDVSQAQFLWIALGDAMPALATLAQGTDAYPDQSATCVIDVIALHHAGASAADWTLRGPGIQAQQQVGVQGLDAGFTAQWAVNQARFPSGVDVFLATRHQLMGLPRTTSITTHGGH